MKIASANLEMAATHASLKQHEIREFLKMWVGRQRPDFEGSDQHRIPASNDTVELSGAGQAAQATDGIKREMDAAVDNDPGLNLIRRMLEFLTGRRVRVFDATTLHARPSTTPTESPESTGRQETPPQPAGYGIEYDYHESYTEIEQTRFAASGTVKTADGREIAFSLELSMTRAYHEESNASLRLGDAVRKTDPLVLNFAGTAAQLDDRRFAFDLDADGHNESINRLTQGSAFLVFDRNRDGTINDGKELFGPTSGDGFAELATLDDDGNGWIDENDTAYAQLQLWHPGNEDQQKLQSLAAAGVGAIALSRLNTPFEIKNNSNRLTGEIRSSGVFLQEDGKTGTIQQVDLTV